MALTDDNSMVMPVAPMYGGNGGSFGGFGGDSWLGILFLIALCNGGWGGFGGFGGFGGGFGGFGNMMLGYDFPWLLNGQNGINSNVNDGFRSAQISDSITSVRDGVNSLATQLCGCCGDVQMSLANGFSGVQNALCSGFAGTTAAVTGAQNAITAQMYNNEIANLNRSFDAQTAASQGFNNVQAQLAQCCCDNRAATQDVKYTIATEACATRAANSQNTQAILDKLCQLELDGYKRENDNLRSQLNMANLAASQTAQTAQILAGQTAEIDGVYNRLKNCPVPSMPVYGNTPIFNCQSGGCGCAA